MMRNRLRRAAARSLGAALSRNAALFTLQAATAGLAACAGSTSTPCVAPLAIDQPIDKSSPARAAEERALDALLHAEWETELADDPVMASRLGDRRYNDRWPDDSEATFAERHARDLAYLRRLRSIDRRALSAPSQLDVDLFERTVALRVEGYPFGLHRLAVDQREGIQTQSNLVQELRFDTLKDYEDWIARLTSFPAYMDRTLALLRAGIASRVVHPRVIMERVPAQIDRQIVPARKSGFWRPFEAMPASFPPAERARLASLGAHAIDGSVVPAFRRMKDFMVKEYLPACLPDVGVWQLPRGAEIYAYEARLHTTTTLTPAQIHATGLAEVARIRAAMQGVMEKVGFKGTLAELFVFLRTDRRFFYDSPEALLEGYRALAKTIDPRLVRLFRTLPRTPYGVEPIEATAAPDTTTAYYGRPAEDGSRAGTYYVNLYQPLSRPRWEMTALSLHESVPGHHLQIALAMESGKMREFRKNAGWSAFVEGWGLYAESLGDELGLYDDPYAKLGQLTYEMWRAVRLVVDTGIHTLHWDRRKAVAYFMENAARPELDVMNEVDRYVAWPGQALAYKIGELEIKALRARAEKALGPAFDVRAFHDAVLGGGALPLDVLGRRIDAWIAGARAEHPPPG